MALIVWLIFCTLISTCLPYNLRFKVHNQKLTSNAQLDWLARDPFDVSEYGVDPESYMNVSQLITSKGYPCEDYTVQTPDGFLLDIQRIPYSPRNSTRGRRPVVFLQHGLLDSSATWVVNLANESLAFLLADAGYDVWLGNVRGNTYGRRHVSLNASDDAFWTWSMDEIAAYDLPAMVNFTLKTTNQSQLYYVGHSQGTFIGFAQFSHDHVIASKIKLFFALAPITTVGHTLSPLRLFKFSKDSELYDLAGRKDFLPNTEAVKFLARTLCDYKYIRSICAALIFSIGGINAPQFNMSRMQVYLTHYPAGTSTRNMIHWLQLVRSDKFQMYDFDSPAENLKHYSQPTPPIYSVSNLTVPVAIFSGGHDWLADPQDVASLVEKLKSLVSRTYIPDYDHGDFIWGLNAPAKVYTKIIQLIRSHP